MGLGGRDERRLVKEFLLWESSDIIVLVETKHECYCRRFVKILLGGYHVEWLRLESIRSSGTSF